MMGATPRMSPQRKGLINVVPSVKVFKKIKVQYISLPSPPHCLPPSILRHPPLFRRAVAFQGEPHRPSLLSTWPPA